MRKKLIVIVALFCMIFTGCGLSEMFSADTESVSSQSNADFSFAVISDIHDNEKKFSNAIDDLYKINSQMDALVFNGDTVDQGIDEQYEEMKKAIDKKSKKLPSVLIKNMGNHEYYDYSEDNVTESTLKDRVDKYLEFSGNSKIYHDEWVKGYHFISLGSDANTVDTINYTSGCISDEQINWLRETIKKDYEAGKPIFVFLHQPPEMKFFNLDAKGIDKDKEILEILNNYPEVILFTSHTHMTPAEEVKENDGHNSFLTVNTGSVNSNYVSDDSDERGFSENKSLSNGIYVEVTNNVVTIKARDFKEKSWIYEIERPINS